MKKYYYIFLGLAITLASCKKEEIPELTPSITSEEIHINGMLGSESINLTSEGNYYMYTNFSFDSVTEIYVFEGELRERYCTDCGPGIKLKISNNKKYPGGIENFNLDSLFEMKSLLWKSVAAEEVGLAELIITKGTETYMSKNSFQPSSNRLTIKDVELYHTNELGQKTALISYEGDVFVSTPEGDKLFTFDGSFAFAYP